jgi:IS5 family transposase
MRQERTVQARLFDAFSDHEIGRELKAMSQGLDEHRELVGLAAEDLRRHGVKETGEKAARRPAGRAGFALRASQAAPPAELRGAGVSSRGLGLVSSLRAAAAVMDAEEVGAAQDSQRHPGRDLGGDQSHSAGQRASRESRDRQGLAAQQHGHRRAHA